MNLALGHRSRETYALTHLAPTKHYQCFALRVARPQPFSVRRQGRQERLRVGLRNLRLLVRRLVFARALLTQGKVNLALGHRSRLLMRSLISPLQSIINALLYG